MKRFLNALEASLYEHDSAACHELLMLFADYHICHETYPSMFGEKINRLVLSMPRMTRKTSRLFPLLPKDWYIKLIQFATKKDHGDIDRLHHALYDTVTSSKPTRQKKIPSPSPETEADALLEGILAEIDQFHLETTLLKPYDEARESFILDASTAEFVDIMTRFFIHLQRYLIQDSGAIDQDRATTEVFALLKRVYPKKQDYNGMLQDKKSGMNGGLGGILNAVTMFLKEETKDKHILRVFKETIDPMEYDDRVQLIACIQRRFAAILPDDITSQPPSRIVTVADDTEFDDTIAEYYSHHFAYAVAPGARLPRAEAAGRAKEIIEQTYRRRFQKDRLDAYTDGKEGTNGGMRAILDIITEQMKMEAIEYHIRDVIDRYIKPSSFDEQVEIIRQYITRYGPIPGIDASTPERYARNYEELIRGIADAINKQAARFRRL